MALGPEPFPSRDAIVKNNGKPEGIFTRWIEQTLVPRIDASPNLTNSVATTPPGSQNAAIPTTAIGPVQAAGVYAVRAYTQVMTPDGAASSFQVTLSWTYGGVAQSETFALKNGNTTATHEGIDYTVRIDGGTAISFSVAYTSTTPGAMHYDSYVSVSLIQLVS